MHLVSGSIIGQEVPFPFFDRTLKNLGFIRAAMFDWHYAAYDYILVKSKIGEYFYLRIYVETTKGNIEESKCEIVIKDVFVTGAQYHKGLNYERKVDKPLLDRAQSVLKQVAEQLDFELNITLEEADELEMESRRGERAIH